MSLRPELQAQFSIKLDPLNVPMRSILQKSFHVPDHLPINAILFEKYSALKELGGMVQEAIIKDPSYLPFTKENGSLIDIQMPNVFSQSNLAIQRTPKGEGIQAFLGFPDDQIIINHLLAEDKDNSVEEIAARSAFLASLPIELLKKVRRSHRPVTIVENSIFDTDHIEFRRETTHAWRLAWNENELLTFQKVPLQSTQNAPLGEEFNNTTEVFFALEKLG